MRANAGAHVNEGATNNNAPLYVDYENSQLVADNGSNAYPLARVKVNDSAFTTGVVGSTKANNVTKGYHSLVTPDGMKLWSYMRNGDFLANHGDIITGTGEKLSEALVYRGYSKTTNRSDLKSGHYVVGAQNEDALRTQFIDEAAAQDITIRSDVDYQLLQVNSDKQDFGILVGSAAGVYLRVNDTGNNGGEQTSPNVAWSQLITSRNLASTTSVGAVKLAFTWKEETQNVVPVSMFRELIEKSVLVGDGNYNENTRGVNDLSNFEPWGSSAVGTVDNYQNIESHVRPGAYSFGVILKLGQTNNTNAKIYIPHTQTKLHFDIGQTRTMSRQMCFYLRTSYGDSTNKNDDGQKSDWFKFLSTDYFAGIPLPWPVNWVPDGFLAMNGAAFDKRRYPRLAQLYPSGHLPDLRGEFIRGWDANRGVDANRGLLSYQDDAKKQTYIEFQHMDIQNSNDSVINGEGHQETMQWSDTGAGGSGQKGWFTQNVGKFNSYSVQAALGRQNGWYQMNDMLRKFWIGEGTETRPRNVAFQYICYAA